MLGDAKDVERSNAIVEQVSVHLTEGGVLQLMVQLNYGGTGQAAQFGLQPRLGEPPEASLSLGGSLISGLLWLADVDDLSLVKGKCLLVKHTWTNVLALGHILGHRWMYVTSSDVVLSEKEPVCQA